MIYEILGLVAIVVGLEVAYLLGVLIYELHKDNRMCDCGCKSNGEV